MTNKQVQDLDSSGDVQRQTLREAVGVCLCGGVGGRVQARDAGDVDDASELGLGAGFEHERGALVGVSSAGDGEEVVGEKRGEGGVCVERGGDFFGCEKGEGATWGRGAGGVDQQGDGAKKVVEVVGKEL